MSALCQKRTPALQHKGLVGTVLSLAALNHAFASQRIHFVAAVAKKPNEHLVRVFSELWRRGVSIEKSLAHMDGAFNSLHVAGA